MRTVSFSATASRSASGTSATALSGFAEGASPSPRKTTGEPDVAAVERDLRSPSSELFGAVKNLLESDLGGLPGDVSAGLSSIDATLYSANSIFGVIPDGDGTNGALEVNGAVIGADVGLLGPRGTRILYDERGKDLLDLRDPERVGIFRLLAAPAPL